MLDVLTLFGIPIFSFFHLKKNFLRLREKVFYLKFSCFYANLNTQKKSVYEFTSLFCLNRFIIGISSVFMQSTSIGSIFPNIACSLFFSCVILHQKPMSSNFYNRLENINSFCLILASYFLMFCSDWLVINPQMVRYNIGFIQNYMLLSVIMINFIEVLYRFSV